MVFCALFTVFSEPGAPSLRLLYGIMSQAKCCLASSRVDGITLKAKNFHAFLVHAESQQFSTFAELIRDFAAENLGGMGDIHAGRGSAKR